jgi:hypothetical protein
MSYQTIPVGSTDNFTVFYEDADRGGNNPYTPDQLSAVVRRAQLVLKTCESDYATLCNWFGVSVGQGFGTSNRTLVYLTTVGFDGKPMVGGANQGYKSPSVVRIDPYATSEPSAIQDVSIASMFAAELSEIMMSYSGGWHRGHSDGEGLSRVSGFLLHPGALTAFFNKAPSDIISWMSFPPGAANLPSHLAFRQDWVSQSFEGEAGVRGDTDPFSYGCAMLFIYYLNSQLGYSMAEIVQSDGSTLEERYQSLTGSVGGYAPFVALLDAFYPPGASLPTSICDLFPLGGRYCVVTASSSIVNDRPPEWLRTGSAPRGTLCGTRVFSYSLYDLPCHAVLTAYIYGFAHPTVSWFINGEVVPAGGSLNMEVSAFVVPVDPEVNVATQQAVTLIVTPGVAPPPIMQITTPVSPIMQTTLAIEVANYSGSVQLHVEAFVQDEFAPAEGNQAYVYMQCMIATQKVVWEPAYRAAVDACANRYITTHNRPFPWLLKFLPDPPPQFRMTVGMLEKVTRDVDTVALVDAELAREMVQALTSLRGASRE